MKRRWIVSILLLCMIAGCARAEMEITPEEFEEWYAPYCQWDGTTVTMNEGIVTLGCYVGEIEDDWKIDPRVEAMFDGNPGGELGFSIEAFSFSRIVWPQSIRILGSESFHLESFSDFTVPAQVEKLCVDAFIYCTFDVFRIEAAIPWQQIWYALDDCWVYAYDVPADHPLYTVRDGVLFSKDGETLLSYPNARKAAHYDVPAGTKRIACYAFDNENLKTVSLPIGLEAVEDYAFSGCTRLQSIALPLTVKEIGTGVFGACVSLDLVSLPQGLTADKNESGGWALYYADDGLFHGDNGDTEDRGKYARSWNGYRGGYARLVGGSSIPVYKDSRSDTVTSRLLPGKVVEAIRLLDGRVWVRDLFAVGELGWVDADNVRAVSNTTLFAYAEIAAPGEGQQPQRPVIDYEISGPLIQFYEWTETDPAPSLDARGVCRLKDADLFRTADAGEGPFGIVVGDDPEKPIALLAAPNGEKTETLWEGDQVKVLEEKDGFLRVSTGIVEGWLPENQVKIVPIKEGNDK